MPDTLSLPENTVELAELIGAPTVELLPRYPILPCDGHESTGIQAIIDVTLPSGKNLQLCGNCAYRHGFASHQNMPTWLRTVDSERKQGSEN